MSDQSPETERLDDVPQEGVEFERLDEAAVVWPITMCLVPEYLVDDGTWVWYWRQWLTDQGRRPQGEPTVRFAQFRDLFDPQTGERLYDEDEQREGWIAEGPADAVPTRTGLPPRDPYT